MPNEFVARNGIISLNNSVISGSLNVTQGMTGSLQGTASWASQALTSSYILSAISASFASTASNILGGAANYIPLFNTATSLSSSAIYQSSGNIGIGTTSPTNNANWTTLTIDNATNGGILELAKAGSRRFIAYVPASSTNVLMATDGANDLLLGTNVAERMRITSTGNLGIGTTSPNAKLDVNGNAIVTGSLTVTSAITAQTLVVQTITSSVDFVTGSTRFGSLLSNTHAFTGSVGMTGSLTVDGNTVVTGSLTTRITRTSSTNAIALTLSDNVTGAQTDGVYKSIRSVSNGTNSVSEIRFLETDGTNNNTSIAFATAPTAGGITERMRINQNGNVGIGTTSPTSLLHIQGSDPFIRINNSSGNDHGIKISYNNSDTHGLHLIYNPNAATASIDNTYPTSAGQVYGDIHIRQNVGGAMTTRMVIKADGGNVGIGTTSPSARLHVSGSTTTNLLVGNSDLFVSASGNVGIGTTSPGIYKLNVNGIFTAKANFSSYVADGVFGATATPSIIFLPNDYALYLGYYSDGNGAYWGRIGANGTGNNKVSFGAYGDSIFTIGTGTSNTERFRITATGNVGIGTASPLEVGGYTGLTINGTDSFLSLYRGGSAVASLATTSTLSYIGSDANTPFTFRTNATERVRIDTSGNVGIGTTSPNARLDVSGSAIVSGSFTVAPSNAVELQVLSTGVKIGNAITDAHNVTGSLSVSGSITGSLFGTASFAVSASWAPAASTFPFTGNAIVTGSLLITTGSLGNNTPVQYTQGYTASLSGSLSVISSVATSSYRSAFYNYVATQGANARAGTVAAVWYLTTCSFAEYITTDIGTTANLDITARVSGGNVQLVALGSSAWLINTSVNLV